ncbi:hypothetical protein M440DRAFT_1463224 [Trichoderma longibrachiatum ATCC 18648]|uniref:NmrA-like domain-containing protein n=1 Tax=Trichoderma longibrachiatum ATCC 18648 TaxID=983965 RepID=A0A2T4C4S6_TRILO|nr:hypothetical protein M440DRAFT_1463224 [Trichoderma longibrachiatum ATCC 18648]
MVFTKLVIAGSSGYVADYAIRAIMACTKPQFDVTILTRRKGSAESPSIPGARVIPVDYFDHDELVKAVAGADAILSFISGLASKVIDKLLLKAAQEAGVRRIFPSEYTLDILHPEAVKLLTEGGDWPEDSSPTYMKRFWVRPFERSQVTSQELLEQRNANLQSGNHVDALLAMIHLAAFNGSGAADLVDGLKFDGDGYLRTQRKTLRRLTVESLRRIGITSGNS